MTRSYLLGVKRYVTYHDNQEIMDRIPAEVDFLFFETIGWAVRPTCVYWGEGGGIHSKPPALLSPTRYRHIILVYNHSTHKFHA
jgi:hypothetical protein